MCKKEEKYTVFLAVPRFQVLKIAKSNQEKS